MEDKRKEIMNYDDEEYKIEAPYNIITYIDDEGHKHIAMINDKAYLEYILDRFTVISNKVVEK